MKLDRNLLAGSSGMLLLKLLEEEDRYGYQIIEELERRSENIFSFKAGTLYPILHTMEQSGLVESYEKIADNGRLRKYYHITKEGRKLLVVKKEEWKTYTQAVNKAMGGDFSVQFNG